MFNNPTIVILLSLLISACGSTATPQKADTTYNQPTYTNPAQKKTDKSAKETPKKFAYEPNGRKQFIFGEVSDRLQEYQYRDICFKPPRNSVYTECSSDKLDYDKYVGKKGFYTDKEPIKDTSSHILREVILETGEILYLVTSSRHKYVGNFFIDLEEHERIVNFKPYPIIEGSSVMITGYPRIGSERLKVSSQNTHTFTMKNIKAIQRIAAQHPKNGVKIAELLTLLKVDYDDFEGRTLVSNLPGINKGSYLSINIIFKDNGTVIPFVVSRYYSDSWLFVKKYSVAADDYRWESRPLNFQRDHTDGDIWEWNKSLLDEDLTTMLSKVAFAEKATVRFYGKYYSDHVVTPAQQKELSTLIQLSLLSK